MLPEAHIAHYRWIILIHHLVRENSNEQICNIRIDSRIFLPNRRSRVLSYKTSYENDFAPPRERDRSSLNLSSIKYRLTTDAYSIRPKVERSCAQQSYRSVCARFDIFPETRRSPFELERRPIHHCISHSIDVVMKLASRHTGRSVARSRFESLIGRTT